ncbi:glycyl-radical enzyme activating protein [Desulfovibrio sp. Huiquan2017]|uniref:(2S)-3-sulfopropanediol dehydratase activating enzyme n=1 Tax=Desulfovibrio sp. Huiquan2017 TaxID=2816861 RepID=UPI001A912C43|nr:glycyl-radical enzyme activating protein [Desulfovibrio sp. Huiquan2017]
MSSISDKKTTGTVFSVQKYSVHDGPGIRTIVFMKGCPLHCAWCSNPESQAFAPQIAYNSNNCIGADKCTHCLNHRADGSITVGDDGKIRMDHDMVGDDFALACVCPGNAIIVYGEEQSVDKVLRRVEEDERFYARSGGGVTLSGGEPFAQPDFALALLREARRRHINTAVETCGQAPWAVVESCLPFVDNFLYDIKSMDDEKHREKTGHTGRSIRENLVKIKEARPGVPIRVRTPVIPGFNDTVGDIEAIIEFVKSLPGEKCEYEALPFHRMGQPKYANLGRTYDYADIVKLDDELVIEIKKLEEQYKNGQ